MLGRGCLDFRGFVANVLSCVKWDSSDNLGKWVKAADVRCFFFAGWTEGFRHV